MILSSDLEWNRKEIDVLGLAYEQNGEIRATATDRNPESLAQYLDALRRADFVIGQSFLSADCRQLAKEGIDTSWLEPKVKDIRLMAHAISGHLAGTGSYDLRSLVLLCGGRQGKRYPLDWKKYESDLHATCAADAGAAVWVYPTLERQIQQWGLERTVAISHQCEPIFARMKEQGVRLDRNVLERLHKARKEKTAQIIERYHLWEERGKKVIKRVPIWRSDKVLDIFEQQFGIRPKDRKRLTWEKLLGDPLLKPEAREFAEAIISLGKGANDAHWLGNAEETEDGIDFSKVGDDGFIHPRYDLCGSPDRAIASGPNIQNFPRPSDDPRDVKLRSAVIPLHDDHILLGVDYSSLETITNAIESNDMDRATAVLEKRLTHEGVAKIINDSFGLSLNRNQGKAVGHGLDKGESPYNLARTLFKTDRPSRQQVLQCQNIVNRMLGEFPKMSAFRDELWERAQENPLVVTNRFGRRLLCFSRAKYGDTNDRFAKHQKEKKYWCSCSVCAPRRDRFKYGVAFLGRSSGFDALLRAMARIWYEKRLDEYSLPVIECHDELLYSVPKDKVEYYKRIVKKTLEEPIPELNGISLPANVVIGMSWAEAH